MLATARSGLRRGRNAVDRSPGAHGLGDSRRSDARQHVVEQPVSWPGHRAAGRGLPFRRLHDTPIGRKAVLIMGVPALAALVMAGFAVLPLARSSMDAERTRTLVAASGAAAGLVQALQSERVAVATVLSPDAP